MRERIVELRKALKLNQAQFAESINLSRNFINLYENLLLFLDFHFEFEYHSVL